MKLVPLNTVFHIEYGNQFDFSKMSISDSSDINFIVRSSKNFGIMRKVDRVFGIEPYQQGLLTICLGGSILESYIQPEPFYTAQNIKVLKPIESLSFNEKLFYCLCIKYNRFRYSTHGREANVSLDTILVPESMPKRFEKVSLSNLIRDFSQPMDKRQVLLRPLNWKQFRYDDLFNIEKGERILNRDMKPGQTPCIRATSQNNGITAFIAHEPNHEGNTITISYNGSIGEAFYQERPFFALDDVNVLYPKNFELNKFIGLFLCALMRKEKFRFNYGRKWHLERMNETIIKLPVDKSGYPDFNFMENYIRGLAYSSAV